MSTGAIPVERGCGRRVAGGVYGEFGLGPGGLPVEAFLMDPPVPTPDGMALAAVGVLLIERNGVTHVVDRVGMQHYPNIADFVEEARRFGVSRRLPSNLDFSRLTEESRLLLVHDRAIIGNQHDWFGRSLTCPRQRDGHPWHAAPCCAGVWWHDVEGGEPRIGDVQGRVLRTMPSFRYDNGHARPEGVEARYQQGFFAAFPLSRLVVVAGGESQRNLERARQAQVQVDEVEE